MWNSPRPNFDKNSALVRGQVLWFLHVTIPHALSSVTDILQGISSILLIFTMRSFQWEIDFLVSVCFMIFICVVLYWIINNVWSICLSNIENRKCCKPLSSHLHIDCLIAHRTELD